MNPKKYEPTIRKIYELGKEKDQEIYLVAQARERHDRSMENLRQREAEHYKKMQQVVEMLVQYAPELIERFNEGFAEWQEIQDDMFMEKTSYWNRYTETIKGIFDTYDQMNIERQKIVDDLIKNSLSQEKEIRRLQKKVKSE